MISGFISKSCFLLVGVLMAVSVGVAATVSVVLPSSVAAQLHTGDKAALTALYDSTSGADWTYSANWNTDLPIGVWYGVTTDSGGRVTRLELSLNNLSGPIPVEVADLSELAYLNLSGNKLSGSIPTQLGNLTELTTLGLSQNALTGGIPEQLGDLTRLTVLGVGHNNLSGPIPEQLGGLAELTTLDLSWNALTGGIPAQLGGLTRLTVLNLYNNALTGGIPTQLGDLTLLKYLDLQDNSLSGAIPAQFSNLTSLHHVLLSDNDICLPSGLSSWSWYDKLKSAGIPDCGSPSTPVAPTPPDSMSPPADYAPAPPTEPTPSPVKDYFNDDDGITLEDAINRATAAGITRSCKANTALFCPDATVSRAQMAAFLVRALQLQPSNGSGSYDFSDTSTSAHRSDIQAIAAVGITRGCKANTALFCPDAAVSRAQMAAFLARALQLQPPHDLGSYDFSDTVTSAHRSDIQAIAAVGITRGCKANTALFCPDAAVSRAQMAAFFARALKL